jgi:hypothetical protein
MKKRNNYKIFGLCFATILFFNACQKCWQCAKFNGAALCIKGVDTFWTGSVNHFQQLQDSENYYNSLGYSCTASYYYDPSFSNVCGKRNYDGYIAGGDSCREVNP